MNIFQKNGPDGKALSEILLNPLQERKISLTVVDVGARNGMFLLPPEYAEKAKYIGFEPNPVEYEKLINKNTDSMELGNKMPRFKEERYYLDEQPIGTHLTYKSNGILWQLHHYSNGKLDFNNLYDDNGKIVRQDIYDKGRWLFWRDNEGNEYEEG